MTARTSSRTAAAARGKRDTHTLSIHLCSRIEPGFTLCFRTKAFGGLHNGSNEWHSVGMLGTQTPCLRRDQILHFEILKPPMACDTRPVFAEIARVTQHLQRKLVILFVKNF